MGPNQRAGCGYSTADGANGQTAPPSYSALSSQLVGKSNLLKFKNQQIQMLKANIFHRQMELNLLIKKQESEIQELEDRNKLLNYEKEQLQSQLCRRDD